MKQLKEDALSNEKYLNDFKGEVEILCSLRAHPNVVLFLGITSPPQPTAIVIEYCKNGSLYEFLR